MIFLSFPFLLGLSSLLLLHWAFARLGATFQNALLLLASAFFYGWIDFPFLGLVLCSAAFNFGLGIGIGNTSSERGQQALLWTGVIVNLGMLGWFKYFNFFSEGIASAFMASGGSRLAVEVVLPLGISYWTFQLTGYLIDVFNGVIRPSRSPLSFFTYVLYFPKMLAGPIERAQQFLPRIHVPRVFSATMASDGIRQIIWGMFAKLVIADNAATLVETTFSNLGNASGSNLLAGAVLYIVQVFGDFAGYSNMAVGISKLFGIPLTQNFRAPLFATNISGFWRRWHISLTAWMMDYVFTPLNFLLRSHGRAGLAISIFITFLAVGIWHGANWTFIAFGLLQGFYFLPLVLRGAMPLSRSTTSHAHGKLAKALSMAGTVTLMSLAFVLLRSGSIATALTYWRGIISTSMFSMPTNVNRSMAGTAAFFFAVEWAGRNKEHALAASGNRLPTMARWAWIGFILFLTGMYMATTESAFIYFSF